MPLQYPVLYKSMDARADQIVANAVATAITDAESLWAPEKFDGVFPVKGFGIRKLSAIELGGKSGTSLVGPYSYMWLWSVATASTWETYINETLSDSCYVVITGIYELDASPDVEAIKIIADGIEYPLIHLTEMYGWDVALAHISHPIIVRPEKAIKIKAKARTVGQKHLGFLGYTIAKRSYLINEL